MTNPLLIRKAARCFGITAAVTMLALPLPAVGVTPQNAAPPLVTLPGNVRPDVKSAIDQGAVDGSLQLDHMLLQLQRPAVS